MSKANPEELELPDFFHPNRTEDEVFLGFVFGEEKKTKVPWKTIRYGEQETTGNKKIYPAFVKRDEVKKAGIIIVSVREDMRKEDKQRK